MRQSFSLPARRRREHDLRLVPDRGYSEDGDYDRFDTLYLREGKDRQGPPLSRAYLPADGEWCGRDAG